MLAPSFWRDEKMARCSFMERLLFQGMWTFAEDSGVGRASPLLLKADIFPYDRVSEEEMELAIKKLEELGLILLYESGEQRYYFVRNFLRHQTINRPTPSTLPLPDDDSLSPPGALTDQYNISKDKLILTKGKGSDVRTAERESGSTDLDKIREAYERVKKNREL